LTQRIIRKFHFVKTYRLLIVTAQEFSTHDKVYRNIVAQKGIFCRMGILSFTGRRGLFPASVCLVEAAAVAGMRF